MKRLLLAVTLFAAINQVNAQEGPALNAIKINPLSLFIATGNVSYERAVNQTQSAQLGLYYSGMSMGGLKYSGFGITPEYRFYIAGQRQALNGVYAAPFVRYRSYTLSDKETSDEASLSSIGGGATIGWQKASSSGFVFDLFIGPSYNKLKFKNETDEEEFDTELGNGLGVRAGFTLGFAF